MGIESRCRLPKDPYHPTLSISFELFKTFLQIAVINSLFEKMFSEIRLYWSKFVPFED